MTAVLLRRPRARSARSSRRGSTTMAFSPAASTITTAKACPAGVDRTEGLDAFLGEDSAAAAPPLPDPSRPPRRTGCCTPARAAATAWFRPLPPGPVSRAPRARSPRPSASRLPGGRGRGSRSRPPSLRIGWACRHGTASGPRRAVRAVYGSSAAPSDPFRAQRYCPHQPPVTKGTTWHPGRLVTDLNELQLLMDRTYGERDRARGIAATVAWLAEETGELAKAVRQGQRRRAGSRAWRHVGLACLFGEPVGHLI